MSSEPPPREWELKFKWVILTGVLLWAFGAVSLIIYLVTSRNSP